MNGESDNCFFCGYPKDIQTFPDNFDIVTNCTKDRVKGYRKFNDNRT